MHLLREKLRKSLSELKVQLRIPSWYSVQIVTMNLKLIIWDVTASTAGYTSVIVKSVWFKLNTTRIVTTIVKLLT